MTQAHRAGVAVGKALRLRLLSQLANQLGFDAGQELGRQQRAVLDEFHRATAGLGAQTPSSDTTPQPGFSVPLYGSGGFTYGGGVGSRNPADYQTDEETHHSAMDVPSDTAPGRSRAGGAHQSQKPAKVAPPPGMTAEQQFTLACDGTHHSWSAIVDCEQASGRASLASSGKAGFLSQVWGCWVGLFC
jgi:hypothetical protein